MVASLEIGARRQLFIDDYIVDQTHAVCRTMHQPAKYVGNPVMIPLYPWEGRIEIFGTVWRDPDDGLFRMWYQGLGGMAVPTMGLDLSGTPFADLGFDPGNIFFNVAYATSEDGIFWERPNLGLVEYEGSKDNNIVLPHASCANVMTDARDPDPERLYKSLYWEELEPDGSLNVGTGVAVAFSPDGLRWTKYAGNPVLTRSSDTHWLLGWDDLHGKYVAYPRPPTNEGNKTRRIGRSVSDDFVTWTEVEEVLAPDAEDPPSMEFYGMPVFKYEGLYLGQLWACHARSEETQTRNFWNTDVQLTVSRDGVAWNRVGGREPFIPNGPRGSIDQGEILTACEPVVMGDELWFYYCAGAEDHGVTGRSGPICLAKLRRDGFVSVDAGEETGTLVTKSFRCDGGLLSINAAARGGSVGVAVLDEAGIQHDGYGRADCALFDGDTVRHAVGWRERGSLDDLRGRDIRLKFYLRSAKLYSFAIGEG